MLYGDVRYISLAHLARVRRRKTTRHTCYVSSAAAAAADAAVAGAFRALPTNAVFACMKQHIELLSRHKTRCLSRGHTYDTTATRTTSVVEKINNG